MSQRDSGWVQLYAEDNQDAVDLHVQAFRLAEELSVPVMVCMDGFVLTHAFEPVDVPTAEAVDGWLPEFRPRQVLDPDQPVTIGAMVGPEAFTEVRYLAHETHLRVVDRIPELGAEFAAAFGRPGADLVRPYACEDADVVVVALGSVLGTLKDAVDELRGNGARIGVLGLTTFRPFPAAAVRAALADVPRVVVLERAFSVGVGGIVEADIAAALAGAAPGQRRSTVVAGLGGRAVTRASLNGVLRQAMTDELPPLTFLDLDQGLLAAAQRHAVAREQAAREHAAQEHAAQEHAAREHADADARVR
jgi:pyruvate ferredoxin oxidoreductase alpha subunit